MLTRREALLNLSGVAAFALCSSVLDEPPAFGRERYIGFPDSPTLDDLAINGIADLEAKVQVVSADQAELSKINRDFGLAYRLHSLTMRYKEPNKLRMEGSIGSLIVNGSLRCFRVPALKLNKKDELGETPGKRYTLMDVGLLSRPALTGTQAHYLRDDKVGDLAARVFELSYKDDESIRYILWVDPRTHVILKREWLDSSGKRKATFHYKEAKQAAERVWVPTRIEIRNQDDVLAAVTAYSDVKVNQGMDDSIFQIS